MVSEQSAHDTPQAQKLTGNTTSSSCSTVEISSQDLPTSNVSQTKRIDQKVESATASFTDLRSNLAESNLGTSTISQTSHQALTNVKSTSLPNQPRRRLSPGGAQGGAVFFNQRRRKQKSFDVSMLPRDSDEMGYLVRARSPSPTAGDTEGGSGSPQFKVDYCAYVVEEILLTERQYMQDLEDIVMGYVECAHSLPSIKTDEVNEVFGNIADLYTFHSSFLYDLETCGEAPVAIAQCFVNRGREFEIYATYVTNYPRSFTCLTRLLHESAVSDAFRKLQLQLGHGLPLGSYLHKPVQRILKYHLLLQSLLKHFTDTSSTSSDPSSQSLKIREDKSDGKAIISQALQCMTDCARHINEMKRSHEDTMKIQEIQSILYNFEGYNLHDFGKHVKEVDMRMYGAKSFRHVYLFEKGLIICKRREDGAMSCKICIMCHNLMLIESVPREPLSFHLVPYDNPRQQHTLQAKTLEQKREWCKLIKKHILDSYNVPIPDKAKELLLTLTGRSETDEKLARQFKSFTLRPHQTPDYIERKRRKSQPMLSPNSETLPRVKKRVRKISVDPSMAPSHLFTQTTNCSTATMTLTSTPNNNPPLNLSDSFSSVSSLEASCSSLPTPLQTVPERTNDIASTARLCFANGKSTSGSDSLDGIRNVDSDLSARDYETGESDEVFLSSNTYPLCSSSSSSTSGSTKTIACKIDCGASDLVLHAAAASKCDNAQAIDAFADSSNTSANISPRSEFVLNVFPATPTPSPSPRTRRRHSFSRSTSSFTVPEEGCINELVRSHDETSDRAKQLQRLLDHRRGLDDPTWCPEVISMVRRYRPPTIKRAESYAKAQKDSLPLPDEELFTPVKEALTLPSDCRSGSRRESLTLPARLEPPSISPAYYQTKSSVDNLIIHSTNTVADSQTEESDDGDAVTSRKTETSQILNRLSQLKEKTSNRLTDLLKKSPVRIFKESQSELTNICDIEAHDVEYAQSIVGRRLSAADMLTPCVSDREDGDGAETNTCSLKLKFDTDTIPELPEHKKSPENHICGLDSLELDRPRPAPSVVDMTSNCDEDVWVRSVEEDKSNSLTRSEGEGSKRYTCYSSDNLADVDENDYVNIDFGDMNDTQRNFVIYEAPVLRRRSLPKINPDKIQPSVEDGSKPPLPPLPEFLLRKRLMNTMLGLDSTLTDLESLKNQINMEHSGTTDTSADRQTKSNRLSSHFWQALDKYIATGKVDQLATPNHKPLANSEPTSPQKVEIRSPDKETSAGGKRRPVSLPEFSPIRLKPGSLFSRSHDGVVYKMARKYSSRIRLTKEEAYRRLRAVRNRVTGASSLPESSTCEESSPATTRRIESIRLRRTNSSRIKKFIVMLDSEDEDCEGCKCDSGAQQCECDDSGSDYDDIYEKNSMAVLESFASDDEMRDSAIFSDGEENPVVSPVISQKYKTNGNNNKTGRRKLRRSHTCKECDDDGFAERTRRRRVLSRSRSVPSATAAANMIITNDNFTNRPVSRNLLRRLESLKKNSSQYVSVSSRFGSRDRLGSANLSSSSSDINTSLVQLVKQRLNVQ